MSPLRFTGSQVHHARGLIVPSAGQHIFYSSKPPLSLTFHDAESCLFPHLSGLDRRRFALVFLPDDRAEDRDRRSEKDQMNLECLAIFDLIVRSCFSENCRWQTPFCFIVALFYSASCVARPPAKQPHKLISHVLPDKTSMLCSQNIALF